MREQEAVELRLGERERALVLDGVLCRQHQERVGHHVGDAVGGDLTLLHGLEESGLRLGRGAVDLVGEDDLRHDRPLAELERAVGLVVDGDACDVGGQQVGSELDALEGAAQGAGQGLGEGRLAHARDILDERVSPADEGDQR